MTNTTNLNTNLNTNLTTGSTIMKNTAKASAMSQVMFSKGLTPTQALGLSAVLIELKEKMSFPNWSHIMERTLRNIPLTIGGVVTQGIEIDGWLDILVSSNLVTVENGVISSGWYLDALYEEKEKSYPRPAELGIKTRRRKLNNTCPSMLKTVQILESTRYTVDEVMLKLATMVYAKLGKCVLTSEQYVIDGCYHLVNLGNTPVVSEFFDDKGGRLYHGDGHGPNGQAGDMSRSFMSLYGESTDYDRVKARAVLMEEISDMVSSSLDIDKEIVHISTLTFAKLTEYVVAALKDNRSDIKKVWSFVKAAGLVIKLDRGETPYIGMAFGKDAKCSGPQLAALLTSDEALAEACGFTDKDVDDAYERVMAILDSSWSNLTRADVKKPYMATFYGQYYLALTLPENYGRVKKSDMEMPLMDAMLNGAGVDRNTAPDMVEAIVEAYWVERAKSFTDAIEASLGKVSNLRTAVKNAHGEYVKTDHGSIWMPKTFKATCHTMPDGVKVEKSYYHKVDANGIRQEYQDIAPDVEMLVRDEVLKFKQMTFKTKDVDLARHGRTGFVSMIHATDAQVARLIVQHLHFLGVKNIISIHDCFRVGINDMIDGKLDQAIRYTYTNLFGSVENRKTNFLPEGTDIIKMYFLGLNKSKHVPGYVHSQFESGERVLHDFMDIPELIQGLGTTTSYFTK